MCVCVCVYMRMYILVGVCVCGQAHIYANPVKQQWASLYIENRRPWPVTHPHTHSHSLWRDAAKPERVRSTAQHSPAHWPHSPFPMSLFPPIGRDHRSSVQCTARLQGRPPPHLCTAHRTGHCTSPASGGHRFPLGIVATGQGHCTLYTVTE